MLAYALTLALAAADGGHEVLALLERQAAAWTRGDLDAFCSVYADEAIGRFGLWAGGWMTLARLLRCQPWGTSGIDNVPPVRPPAAKWYLPWRYGRWRGVNDTEPMPDRYAD